MDKIIIGTRGSKLALWQANFVKNEIESKYKSVKVDLKIIKTKGDKILDVPLAKVGGKGLFVKEIEEALLREEVDLAVHSMKDVPTFFPNGLYLPVITKREDYRDAFISKNGLKLKEMPENSVIGTSSLRRKSQLINLRKDFQIKDLRGNVDTRLRKLDEGQFDGIILAVAGLKRMGFSNKIVEFLDEKVMIPAIGQGALGIEIRENDNKILDIISFLKDDKTFIEVSSERAFLKELEGGCQVPIGCYAKIENEKLKLIGFVADLKGERFIKDEFIGNKDEFINLGVKLARKILNQGAKDILEEVYKSN